MAPDEAVLVAGPETALVDISLVAPTAMAAEDEAHPAAGLAGPRGGGREALDDPPELAGFVEEPYLVGAADVAAGDEDLRERERASAEEDLELADEGGVHGEVALVDGHRSCC